MSYVFLCSARFLWHPQVADSEHQVSLIIEISALITGGSWGSSGGRADHVLPFSVPSTYPGGLHIPDCSLHIAIQRCIARMPWLEIPTKACEDLLAMLL
uniref:UBC core domain-containing protein n=2 Tax=Steinernema glaseri TaxID=37863 RepID=A0A1I7XWQ7_9BILA